MLWYKCGMNAIKTTNLELHPILKIEDDGLSKERNVPSEHTRPLRGVGLQHDEHAPEAQLPLLTVVSLIESKKFGSQTIRNLGGTTPLAHHLKSLASLWRSLGRPDNVFWRSTTVFYNRIVDAPDSDKA
jgi:hypothetical protein